MTDRLVIVFAGPSLHGRDLPAGLTCELLPPAAQGDLAAAVLRHPRSAIALIDGVFHGAPAVRHKEILWALSRGIPVFGAASMGALRAAELHPFGMEGRGLIYRWYRRRQGAPDDAVAVLHAPAELGFAPLTDALMDIRLSLRRARRAGLITLAQEQTLNANASSVHYADRTLRGILERACPAGDIPIGDILRSHRSQKSKDAVNLLEELATRQMEHRWPSIPQDWRFEWTDVFRADLTEAGFSMDEIAHCC